MEFNHGGILIKEDDLLNLAAFFNLLDSFANEGFFPASLNSLFMMKLFLSTDHWLYNECEKLQDLDRIKGFEEQMNSLLILAHQSEAENFAPARISRILFSMTQVMNYQIKSKCYRINSSCGLNMDETNMVIGLTNMVKKGMRISRSVPADQDFIYQMEEMKRGYITVEHYGHLKTAGQKMLQQRCVELMKRNFDFELVSMIIGLSIFLAMTRLTEWTESHSQNTDCVTQSTQSG